MHFSPQLEELERRAWEWLGEAGTVCWRGGGWRGRGRRGAPAPAAHPRGSRTLRRYRTHILNLPNRDTPDSARKVLQEKFFRTLRNFEQSLA